MKRFLLFSMPVLSLFVLLSATPAFAGTTANITVQANVVANCTINAGDIDFADYDPAGTNASSPLNAQGTFTIRCTRGTAATIGLSLGLYASGSTRQMASGTDRLAYELYRDSGRTQVWGTTAGTTLNPYEGELGSVASNSGVRTVTVYGRVPEDQQSAAAGLYADTVVATINF